MRSWTCTHATGRGLCWAPSSWPPRSGMTKLCGTWTTARYCGTHVWRTCEGRGVKWTAMGVLATVVRDVSQCETLTVVVCLGTAASQCVCACACACVRVDVRMCKGLVYIHVHLSHHPLPPSPSHSPSPPLPSSPPPQE